MGAPGRWVGRWVGALVYTYLPAHDLHMSRPFKPADLLTFILVTVSSHPSLARHAQADLKKEGRITEPEYLLFKLLQMQKVDQNIIRRLQETFWQLDANNTGRIELGEGMDLPRYS